MSLVVRDQGPESVNVDSGAKVPLALEVKVTHAHLAKVARVAEEGGRGGKGRGRGGEGKGRGGEGEEIQ